MNWSDEGFLISKTRFNENSLIAELFTKDKGKISGIIFGGTSKKIKNYLQIGNKLHVNYNSKNENNEKIEFLGDRVLGLVIAKKLLEIYPEEKEGILDKKFASLVNKKTCLDIAKKINLASYVKTFNPKNKKIKIED